MRLNSHCSPPPCAIHKKGLCCKPASFVVRLSHIQKQFLCALFAVERWCSSRWPSPNVSVVPLTVAQFGRGNWNAVDEALLSMPAPPLLFSPLGHLHGTTLGSGGIGHLSVLTCSAPFSRHQAILKTSHRRLSQRRYRKSFQKSSLFFHSVGLAGGGRILPTPAMDGGAFTCSDGVTTSVWGGGGGMTCTTNQADPPESRAKGAGVPDEHLTLIGRWHPGTIRISLNCCRVCDPSWPTSSQTGRPVGMTTSFIMSRTLKNTNLSEWLCMSGWSNKDIRWFVNPFSYYISF